MVAAQTVKYHRYEAQVDGGRLNVLLTRQPPSTVAQSSGTLLPTPIKLCLRNKIVGIEMDTNIGKTIAYCSWFLLIFGRSLCLVISFKASRVPLIVVLILHCSLMLLYLLSSQSVTLAELPSRLFNVTISIIALVEISVRFFKIPLLYSMFFISLFVEDTFLMILFFVYPPILCLPHDLACTNFGLCCYLVINSHIIGTILFAVYLGKFRPRKKCYSTNASTISIVSVWFCYNLK